LVPFDATDRTIDGTPTLFAEEIQSDWAIAGAKRGYRTKGESIKGKAGQTGRYTRVMGRLSGMTAHFPVGMTEKPPKRLLS
jgi:hypothetical protein